MTLIWQWPCGPERMVYFGSGLYPSGKDYKSDYVNIYEVPGYFGEKK